MNTNFRPLRRAIAALGWLAFFAVPAAWAGESAPGRDPITTPLWQGPVETIHVADSLPMRRARYQLLALPLALGFESVSAVLGDDLGSYNRAAWRLGHWDPTRAGTDKYIEPSTLANVERGLGYWLITADSTNRVDFERPAANADTVELPLLQGPGGASEWNQLGNPFAFNSAVANWRVVKRDSVLTLGQAAARTWIDANMRTWDPDASQYSAAGTIPRYRGFWARLVDPDVSAQWTRWLAHDTTGNAGYWSSVRLDSKGVPHISFFFNSQLRYVSRNGNTWLREIIQVPGGGVSEAGVFSSIDLDSTDSPYIAHQGWGPQRPFFTRRQTNGAWTIPEQIEPQVGSVSNGWGLKLKVFHGGPRVAYGDNAATGAPFIKYAEKTVSGWNVQTVSALGSVPDQVSHDLGFDVSQTGIPHIATVSRSAPYSLRYFTRSGANWITERVDTLAGGGSTGLSPSLILDATGVPHISYFDQANVDLKYARRTGGTWSVETVDATGNTGNFSEILIQPNGQPAVAFLEYASMGVPNRIRYAVRTGGGSWQIETVDDVGVSAGQAYLGATLDPDGNPRITYQGSAVGLQLRYAEKIRGTWRIKVPPVPAPEPALAQGLAKPEGAKWAIAVTASQGQRAAETMLAGAADPEAVPALRSARAPAPPEGGQLSLHAARGGESWVRDFLPDASTLRWMLRTEGGDAPGEQALEFTGFDLPPDLRIYLEDRESGVRREVRPGDRVTLAARPRELELIATRESGGLPTLEAAAGLSFAYPNPFAASTGLAFTLPREGDIRVELFDVSGRHVRSLARPRAAAGEHVLVWDGRDDSGRGVASGVYLARWQTGGLTGSRRLIKLD